MSVPLALMWNGYTEGFLKSWQPQNSVLIRHVDVIVGMRALHCVRARFLSVFLCVSSE